MNSTYEAYRQRALLAIMIALLLSLTMPRLLGFSVDIPSFLPVFEAVCFFGAILPILYWRRMRSLFGMIETTALTLLVSFASLVLSYAGMRFNAPLADQMLTRMDASIGLSTINTIRLTNASPQLSLLLSWSYTSFIYQIIAAPVLLSGLISPRRAYQFIVAYVVLILISVVVSIPFPSHGAVIGQGFNPSDFMFVNEDSSRGFIKSLTEVRSSTSFVLSLQIAKGILTFPSIHAGMGALFIWGAWPSAVLRWPALALNSLMIASAITCGSHYFVDVAAGCIIAVVAARAAACPPAVQQSCTTHDRPAVIEGRGGCQITPI
jgi:membrane-associated phospholipid phosphatase